MSDQTYAKLQAQQKTLTGSSRRLLQRTCACGGSPGIDRLCTECRDQRLTLQGSQIQRVPTSSHIMDAVQRAATDNSRSLDQSVRGPLEQNLGHNFSQVRVHYGPASSLAAEHLGARAYTLGSDIYLGKEAHQLSRPQYHRLLAHEAVHTVQQGGRPVAPQAKLEVSRPTDAAEIEADHLAESIISNAERPPTSPALALRDQFRVTPATPSTVSQGVAPLIQRDLAGAYGVKDGTFKLNLKRDRLPDENESGMSGTIKFEANEDSLDSDSIRLIQVVRVEDLTTGKDLHWTGEEANRNKVMTAENKAEDIRPGYFVDISHENLKPRTEEGDRPVSPYYRDYFPNIKHKTQDGSKKGQRVEEASLWDFPAWDRESRFSFETVAIAADKDFYYAYGAIHWGFTIEDASKGLVGYEYAYGYREPSATLATSPTFVAALIKFHRFYRNPGASTAPK